MSSASFIIANCEHVQEDGCCGHSDSMTPECSLASCPRFGSVQERFIEVMIPILKQESGMCWGAQSVGRIIRWVLQQSRTQIVDSGPTYEQLSTFCIVIAGVALTDSNRSEFEAVMQAWIDEGGNGRDLGLAIQSWAEAVTGKVPEIVTVTPKLREVTYPILGEGGRRA